MKAHEKTLFAIVQRKGEKGSVGSPTQTLVALKKNKGKEKVLEPREESLEHINFHSSFESNGDVHSLILLLNGLKRGKKGK
jgi:hypothetical protein